MNPYVYMPSGSRYYYKNPNDSMIKFSDITQILSREQRFNNTLRSHWSILQHALLVQFLTLRDQEPEEFQYTALHHDNAKAYMKDVPSPLRKLLPDYNSLYAKCADAIKNKLQVPHCLNDLPQEVADNDLLAMKIEWFLFSGQDPEKLGSSKELVHHNNEDGALLARISELLNMKEDQVANEFVEIHKKLARKLDLRTVLNL